MKEISIHEIFSMNMEFLLSSSVLFATSLLLFLLSFIFSHVLRINKEDKDVDNKLTTEEISDSKNRNSDTIQESSEFTFKFQHQVSNQPQNKEEENQTQISTKIHKYQFVPDEDVSGFEKAPEIQVCRIEESCLDPAISYSDVDTKQSCLEASHNGDIAETINQPSLAKDKKSASSENSEEQIRLEVKASESLDEIKRQNLSRFLSEEFSGLNSESDSISVSDGYSVKDLIIDSDGILSDEDVDEFQHKSVTSEESTTSSAYKVDIQKDRESEEAKSEYFHFSDTYSLVSKDSSTNLNPGAEQNESNRRAESSEIQNPGEAQDRPFDHISIEMTDSSDDELLHSTRDHLSSRENSEKIHSEEEQEEEEEVEKQELIVSEEDGFFVDDISQPLNTNLSKTSEKSEFLNLQRDLDVHEPKPGEAQETEEKGNEISEKNNLKKNSDNDDKDLNSVWEHGDLIEQLKMEIRSSRTNGLPTIVEESESPRSVEDLKSCKIDDKSLRADPNDELNKFYNIYIERMRKLDILNYQKLYAIGFHQMNDPLEILGNQKLCIQTISSIMSQNCPLRRRSSNAPSVHLLKELRCELELVYVAQMCLSWEFLRWQYEKTRELLDSDSQRDRHYNQVAGEFQKFQVVIQRFIEDETFQGTRLQNYVKNRCVLRNLLQVPLVKEDSLKDRMEEQQKHNFIITSEMLEDIMEESIRMFWEFVKAEKEETSSFLKGLMGPNAQLQDSSDYELFADIQSDLQKKEKKVSDILRTGNCLVKKFKKPKEDRSNQDIFFSQIDLKLVSRVVRMPRVTSEQLVWCKKKLSKIVIVQRKIHREPFLLLFPC